MKKKGLVALLFLSLILVDYILYTVFAKPANAPQPEQQTISQTTSKTTTKNQTEKKSAYYEPVAEFKKRITKKKFGTYITPENSPVQPERFSGYHTGVDVEYQDVTSTVNVHAIADGTVLYSGWVSGYGGVTLLTHKINGANHTVLYGHLAPNSLLAAGTQVKANQVIGHLGKNHSTETDGERRHLHFTILSDNRQDFRGYVSTKEQLSGWLNPLSIY